MVLRWVYHWVDRTTCLLPRHPRLNAVRDQGEPPYPIAYRHFCRAFLIKILIFYHAPAPVLQEAGDIVFMSDRSFEPAIRNVTTRRVRLFDEILDEYGDCRASFGHFGMVALAPVSRVHRQTKRIRRRSRWIVGYVRSTTRMRSASRFASMASRRS